MIEELIADHEWIRNAKVQLEKEIGLGKLIFDLGDLLERHIRREERELFPLFEQQASVEDAQDVAQKIRNILGPRLE